MEAPTDSTAGAARRQRERLGRSIVQSQLITSAAVLVLAWIVVLVSPTSLENPLFFSGLALIFVVTGIALMVPWTASNKRWAVILPILDILALAGLREGALQLGSGLLLVFPVIWLARNFKLGGAIGGVALSTALIWLSWAVTGTPISAGDFPGLVILPLTLSFVATTSYVSGRRNTSQRVLLTQQAQIIEEAFDRARKQEALLQQILDAVEFGVIAFDRNGSVSLINESQRKSLADFGAPRSAVIHTVAYQSDRITPFPQDSRPFSRATRGQSFENLVFWIGDPGSRQVAFSVTARRLVDPSGVDDGGTLVLRDVTAELEAINARDSLIGSVSHELRTPLTSILGYLELALDDPQIADDTRHMIDVSYRNAERLVALVTDLLLAASQADQELPITLEVCNLTEIVADAIDAQRFGAEEHRIAIDGELEPSVIAQVDPLRIRQVVDNLLSNAIKYNRTDGRVTVALTSRANSVTIAVRDTGLGISPADLAQLFDRFFRTESARNSATVGTGLGLGITRDIVRRHGGDLVVTSELGVGSVFTVTLPTEDAHEDTHGDKYKQLEVTADFEHEGHHQ
jgi:signal transduction histidine kinase